MRKISFIFLTIFFLLLERAGYAAWHTPLEGIRFDTTMTWSEVKARARAENKYIFVECNTTWCGPCKYMAQNIFPLKEVGDYFNTHFISVSVQMDQGKRDDRHTREWYQDAAGIAKQYGVTAYPTYLFFAPDGRAVHRFEGAFKSGGKFISSAEDALDTSKQYYTLVDNYKQHLQDSTYLRKAIAACMRVSDKVSAAVIYGAYFDCIVDRYNKDNLNLGLKTLNASGGKVFTFLQRNADAVNSAIFPSEEDVVQGKLRNVVVGEEVGELTASGSGKPDWGVVAADARKKYPEEVERIVQESKISYYQMRRDWSGFFSALVPYMDRWGNTLDPIIDNNFAWLAFLTSSQKPVLRKALQWSRLAFGKTDTTDFNYINYLDTYANLLYKLGDKTNATVWEKKALSLAQTGKREDKVKDFKEGLEKMENGDKTWH